jgi:hypothetical protein
MKPCFEKRKSIACDGKETLSWKERKSMACVKKGNPAAV